MRHGKPLLPKATWLPPAEKGGWIAGYDRCVANAAGIPAAGLELAGSVARVAASTLPRSLSSVQFLGREPTFTDALFCEAGLTFAPWRFPRLPPRARAVFFRLLWYIGYSPNTESLAAAQARAGLAAAKLIALAEGGGVLLVGHGVMNPLIARELMAQGWSQRGRQDNGYWGAGVYELETCVVN